MTTQTELALGTVCSVTFYERGFDHVFEKVFERVREIENLMSVNIASSDVSRINVAAGIEPVIVHKDTYFVIDRAIFYAYLSDGAFDPSIGPLVNLWGINNDNPRVPSPQEIENILPLVNWENIILDEESFSVFLTNPGMALDLGAIAKGYAADEAARIIMQAGVTKAIINFGGNIVVVGEREKNAPWRIGIQDPKGEQGEFLGIVRITPANFYNLYYEQSLASVVTSGLYERYFEIDGNLYHHIFSPFTGYPIDNDLASVTIITRSSIDADALSTVLFVLGYEKGREEIESWVGTDAVFVFKDGSVRFTDGVDFVFVD